MNLNIWGDFQFYISVTLMENCGILWTMYVCLWWSTLLVLFWNEPGKIIQRKDQTFSNFKKSIFIQTLHSKEISFFLKVVDVSHKKNFFLTLATVNLVIIKRCVTKAATRTTCNFIKKRLQHRRFPVKFANF